MLGRKKKKNSAIPDFWLEDGPMPNDLPAQVESKHEADSADSVRSRLSGMRKRSSADEDRGQSTPKTSVRLQSAPQEQTSKPQKKPLKQKTTKKLSRRERKQERLRHSGTYISPGQQTETKAGRLRSAHSGSPQEQPAVSISINMPSLRLPKVPWQKAKTVIKEHAPDFTKKQWIGIGSLGILLVVVVASGVFMAHGKKNGGAEVQGTQAAGIDFKPLVPATVNGTKDAPELKVDSGKHIVSFQDTYGQTQFTVSQQNIPENIKADPGAFTAMLSNFGASESNAFDTNIGRMYLATKTNPAGSKQQFAIIKLNDSLMFISAKRELSQEVWKEYLATLHVARD